MKVDKGLADRVENITFVVFAIRGVVSGVGGSSVSERMKENAKGERK